MRRLYNLLGRPPLIVLPVAIALPVLVACGLLASASEAGARGPELHLRNGEMITTIPGFPNVFTGCAYGQRLFVASVSGSGGAGGSAVTAVADAACGPAGPEPAP